MTTKEFCYWLQGSLELNENESFNKKQTTVLKKHLDMVFEHIAHLDEKNQPKLNSIVNFKPLERC